MRVKKLYAVYVVHKLRCMKDMFWRKLMIGLGDFLILQMMVSIALVVTGCFICGRKWLFKVIAYNFIFTLINILVVLYFGCIK